MINHPIKIIQIKVTDIKKRESESVPIKEFIRGEYKKVRNKKPMIHTKKALHTGENL